MVYRSRLWAKTKSGFARRLGGRWGGLTLAGPGLLAGLAGLAASGGSPVTSASIALAIASGLIGVFGWIVLVAAVSFVAALSEVDADLRADRDGLAGRLIQLTAVRWRLTPRPRSALASTPMIATLWVENTADGEIVNCRGKLIGITRKGWARTRTLDIPLSWARPDNSGDPTRRTFHGGAELEVAVQSGPNYMIPAWVDRRTVIDPQGVQIPRDADNVLGIEIAADGVSPIIEWFHLKWWSFVIVPGENGGNDTLYTLPDAQIEFDHADG